MGFVDRLANVWNVFKQDKSDIQAIHNISLNRSGKSISSFTNTKTLLTSIKTSIANDCASVLIKHVTVDENENFTSSRSSGLNRCLSISSNLDQSAREFRLDLFYSLLDEGDIAIVPVDTSISPLNQDAYDILSLRIGKIQQWANDSVQVHLYDERYGLYKDVWMKKRNIGIVENPFYHIMNAPNSTFKRLESKLALLDSIDNINASAKLDLIVQLPHPIRSISQQELAQKRRDEIVQQLQASEYGIAYIGATERITQLNRPIENNLMPQIEYLTKQLYQQLGINDTLLNGTASEQEMLNYTKRIIQPLMESVVGELTRKFITKTGYSQGQRIKYFTDRFKLVPLEKITNLTDVMSRNAIMSPNEIRSILGLKASSDNSANTLANRNMPSEMRPRDDANNQSNEDPMSLTMNDLNDSYDDSYDD